MFYVVICFIIATSNVVRHISANDVDHLHGNIFDQSHKAWKQARSLLENDKARKVASRLLHVFSRDYVGADPLRSTKNSWNLAEGNCEKELEFMMHKWNSSWVLRMLDSFGKPGSGIMDGNLIWPGDYDECLRVNGKVTTVNQTLISIHGRYCLARLQMVGSLAAQLRYGLCFPSACQSSDIFFIINSTIHGNPLLSNRINLVDLNCNQDSVPLDGKAIAAIVVLSLFGAMLLCGTLYDILTSRPFWVPDPLIEAESDKSMLILNKPVQNGDAVTSEPTVHYSTASFLLLRQGKVHSILMAFSLYTNTKKLFNTKVTPNTVHGVNGVRVLSLAWVIFGHCYSVTIYFMRNLLPAYSTLPKLLSFQPVLNSTFSVDSFFFLSGVLVSYNLFMHFYNDPSKLRSVKTWILYYVHRYLRLTPFYMIIVLVYLGFSGFWSQGPFGQSEARDLKYCKDYWWTNLLYINNFWDFTKSCFPVSWYLANDMQFHFIAPLILVPLFVKPFAGMIVLSLFFLVQFLYRGIMSAHLGLYMNEGGMIGNTTQLLGLQGNGDSTHYYSVPYSRIAPYLVGILTGYALYRHSIKPRKVNKFLVIMNWCLTVAIIFALLYCTYDQDNGRPSSMSFNAFWNSINKTLWGLACGWIIYATNVGHGGIIGEFLSWKGWTPLARLTYAAYLVHVVVLSCYIGNIRTPVYYQTFTTVLMFFSIWIFTYFFSYIASMTVEVPLMSLEKLLFSR